WGPDPSASGPRGLRNYARGRVLAGSMRRDAARLAALVAILLTVFAVADARAGTYDVVSCHAPGADMRNLAWTFETFNATGKPAPPAQRFTLNPLSPEACTSAIGVTLTSEAAKQTVMVDDGAAWVFRAPAG